MEYNNQISELIQKIKLQDTLNVIASRPAMGKSTLLFDIAKFYLTNQNGSVIIFSLESSKSSIENRFNDVSKDKLFIYDKAGISIEEIKDKCISLKNEQDIDLVIVDYLQLLTTEQTLEDGKQEISYICSELKKMAQELKLPVLLASQLSNKLELREDKRPNLEDFVNSSSLKQDADLVLFLYRDDYYNKNVNNSELEIIIAKNNNGEIGVVKIKR